MVLSAETSREKPEEAVKTPSSSHKKPFAELERKGRSRFVLYPIRFPVLWKFYQKAQDSFWTPEEVSFDSDVNHFDVKLNDDERFYISRVLAYFGSSDTIVTENLVVRFYEEVPIQEARMFYTMQGAIESVHSIVYSNAIDALVDPNLQDELFNAVTRMPCVARKAEWALKWITSDRPFSHRLVAFAAVEGLFFSGSFASIFWLKKRGLMPGLVQSNELISRDEGLHWSFAMALMEELPEEERCPKEVAREILMSAVDCEIEFVCEALPVRLVGLNHDAMRTYIQFVADVMFSLLNFGKGALYGVENPWDWMDFQGTVTKTDFFRGRDTNYTRQKQEASSAPRVQGDTSAHFDPDMDF